MDNIEVEIKLRLNDINAEKIKQWLSESNAQKIAEIVQEDIYFEPENATFVYVSNGIKKADAWLRIRKQDEKNSICYKYWHYSNGVTLYADEYETRIEKPEVMELLLKALGYKRLIVVNKHREISTSGDFEIAIDNVKELGNFVEIEYKNSSSDTAAYDKQRLYNLLATIGIDDFEEDEIGYPALLLNLKNVN
jgi:predicted adenylyl cyclase CyaB